MNKIILSVFRKISNTFFKPKARRFYPLKKAYGIILRRLRNTPIDVMGNKMFLDPTDNIRLLARGIHEPFETELFRQTVKEGDVVLDIGAHIGYYTLIASKIVGSSGKVYAFEPDPTFYSILERNIKLNGCKNVIAINKAVNKESGEIKLFQPVKYANTTIVDKGNEKKYIKVQAVSIDDCVDDVVDVVKMDIEGAEYIALKGMVETFRKNTRMKVFIEVSRPHMPKDVKPHDILRFFAKRGFVIYNIDEKNKEKKMIEEYDRFSDSIGSVVVNLLCVRDG